MNTVEYCKKVVITGPVGVGKTTIINNLCTCLSQRDINYRIVPEYIDTLPDANEKLSKYLINEISSLEFQTYVTTYYDYYLQLLTDITPDTILIFERVPDDALYCFAKLDLQKGRLTYKEYQQLVDLTMKINKKYNLPSYSDSEHNCLIIKTNETDVNSQIVNTLMLSGSRYKNNIIGLFNDPKTCLERIRKRNRAGENYNIETVILFNNMYKEVYAKIML